MFSLQVLDSWHDPSMVRTNTSLLFSRSDRRLTGTDLSFLDRFYLAGKFLSSTSTIHIMLGTTCSDHALVILLVSTQNLKKFSNMKILENMLLDNYSFSLQVTELWSQKDIV